MEVIEEMGGASVAVAWRQREKVGVGTDHVKNQVWFFSPGRRAPLLLAPLPGVRVRALARLPSASPRRTGEREY